MLKQVSHGLASHVEVIASELWDADSDAYRNALLSFVNCLIRACDSVADRSTIRKELLALGLGDLLENLQQTENEAIRREVKIFHEHLKADNEQLQDIYRSHQHLLERVFSKVLKSSHDLRFRSIMFGLLQLETSDTGTNELLRDLEVTVNNAVANTRAERCADMSRRRNKLPTSCACSKDTPKRSYAEYDDTNCGSPQAERGGFITAAASAGYEEMSTPKRRQCETRSCLEMKSPVSGLCSHAKNADHARFSPPRIVSNAKSCAVPVQSEGAKMPTALQLSGSIQAPLTPPQPPPPPPPPPPPLLNPRNVPMITATTEPDVNCADANKTATCPPCEIKLKKLNWNKLPNTILAGESVWTDAVRSNSMIAQIDFKRMEELFCQKKAVAYSRRVSAPARLSSEPKVQILDCKRNFSINIFLKQFKQYKGMGEAAGVVDMILNVRSKEIGIDGLRNLLKLLPTKEEMEKLMPHAYIPGQLDTAEKFLVMVADIPSCSLRVEAMLEKEEFQAQYPEVMEHLQSLTKCCLDLVNSVQLKNFLALILQMGNYLNAGSHAGNAVGFKLNTLPRLLDTLSNNPKVTFLHYVVEEAEKIDREALQFTTNLAQLHDVAKLPLDCLQDDVRLIVKRIAELKKKLHADEVVFCLFKEFIESAAKYVSALENSAAEFQESWTRFATHFCEDPAKSKPGECFGILSDFFRKITLAREENIKRCRNEEKATFKNAQNLPIQKLARNPQFSAINSDSSTNNCLLEEIKKGDFKLHHVPT